MTLILTVVASDEIKEKNWTRDLEVAVRGISDVRVQAGGEPGQIVFLDGSLPDLENALSKIDRRGRAIFLMTRDGATYPSPLSEGRVDDVLVHPFRPVEVRSKIMHYQQILMWDEVSRLNTSFNEVIDRLRDDLKLAERLQKSKLPSRFPEIKGFKVTNRYLAGMKSGGDHFDIAESKDGSQLSIVLSDSSSYGLSSAVLSALIRVTVKLSSEEVRSCNETVRRIQDELIATLNEKDRLSLFYGILSRRDYRLRYLNLGTSCAYYASPGSGFKELPAQGQSIARDSGAISHFEGSLNLEPGGRLVLVSDGFVDCIGDVTKVCAFLDGFRDREAVDAANEMVFRVKSEFESEEDMPAQDCTAVVFDVDGRVMRLAQG